MIGLVAALVVAVLLAAAGPLRHRASSGRSTACSVVATKVAGNTANIPQLEATAPVLG